MVRWIAKIVEGDALDYFSQEKIVGVHKCTDQDWIKFHKPNRGNKIRIEALMR